MSVELKTVTANACEQENSLRMFVRAPFKSPFRKAVFLLHKWVGAVVALWILTMSLSGVAIVFREEINAALCPSPSISVGDKQVAFETFIANVKRQYPGYRVTGFICPPSASEPTQIYASNDKDKNLALIADPYSGQILGPVKEHEVLKFVVDLHHNLLNGKIGRAMNGVGGCFLLLLAISGVIVWWRGIKEWAGGLRFGFAGSFRRVSWSMHSAVGAWALPFLLVWGVSGFYFGFTAFFEKSLNVVFPVSSQKKEEAVTVSSSDAMRSVDGMVEAALARAPGREDRVERIAFPDKRRPTLRIWLSQSAASVAATKTQVFLDPATGKILAIAAADAAPAGDVILNWLTRLHFGDFSGIVSKSLWVVIGLMPATLAVSGLALFVHRIVIRGKRTQFSSGRK